MMDLIIFSVGSNRYALNIENIQRIIQSTELTNIPNSHSFLDGMMSYEDGVIKVLNFRKLIGLIGYDTELRELFKKLKIDHINWIEELKSSVNSGTEFTKTTNPHKCELGVWLNNFNSYDEKVSLALKNLIQNHKLLHEHGAYALEVSEYDIDKAKEIFNTSISSIYKNTIKDIDDFIDKFDIVANSLQKLIIYEKSNISFAIKVDSIEDIVHIEDSEIMNSEEDTKNEFLELDGVLDIDGVLINVIKTVKIPNKGD